MRARDRDRDAAIDQVRAAYDAGLIIEADRDLRIDQLRQASTVQDIELVVRDLALRAAHHRTAAPPVAASHAPARRAAERPAERAAARAVGRQGGKVVLIVIGVFAVITFVLPVLFFLVVLVVVGMS